MADEGGYPVDDTPPWEDADGPPPDADFDVDIDDDLLPPEEGRPDTPPANTGRQRPPDDDPDIAAMRRLLEALRADNAARRAETGSERPPEPTAERQRHRSRVQSLRPAHQPRPRPDKPPRSTRTQSLYWEEQQKLIISISEQARDDRPARRGEVETVIRRIDDELQNLMGVRVEERDTQRINDLRHSRGRLIDNYQRLVPGASPFAGDPTLTPLKVVSEAEEQQAMQRRQPRPRPRQRTGSNRPPRYQPAGPPPTDIPPPEDQYAPSLEEMEGDRPDPRPREATGRNRPPSPKPPAPPQPAPVSRFSEELALRAEDFNQRFFGGEIALGEVAYKGHMLDPGAYTSGVLADYEPTFGRTWRGERPRIEIAPEARQWPAWQQDYLLMHELTHAAGYHGHGQEFWGAMAERYPQTRYAHSYYMGVAPSYGGIQSSITEAGQKVLASMERHADRPEVARQVQDMVDGFAQGALVGAARAQGQGETALAGEFRAVRERVLRRYDDLLGSSGIRSPQVLTVGQPVSLERQVSLAPDRPQGLAAGVSRGSPRLGYAGAPSGSVGDALDRAGARGPRGERPDVPPRSTRRAAPLRAGEWASLLDDDAWATYRAGETVETGPTGWPGRMRDALDRAGARGQPMGRRYDRPPATTSGASRSTPAGRRRLAKHRQAAARIAKARRAAQTDAPETFYEAVQAAYQMERQGMAPQIPRHFVSGAGGWPPPGSTEFGSPISGRGPGSWQPHPLYDPSRPVQEQLGEFFDTADLRSQSFGWQRIEPELPGNVPIYPHGGGPRAYGDMGLPGIRHAKQFAAWWATPTEEWGQPGFWNTARRWSYEAAQLRRNVAARQGPVLDTLIMGGMATRSNQEAWRNWMGNMANMRGYGLYTFADPAGLGYGKWLETKAREAANVGLRALGKDDWQLPTSPVLREVEGTLGAMLGAGEKYRTAVPRYLQEMTADISFYEALRLDEAMDFSRGVSRIEWGAGAPPPDWVQQEFSTSGNRIDARRAWVQQAHWARRLWDVPLGTTRHRFESFWRHFGPAAAEGRYRLDAAGAPHFGRGVVQGFTDSYARLPGDVMDLGRQLPDDFRSMGRGLRAVPGQLDYLLTQQPAVTRGVRGFSPGGVPYMREEVVSPATRPIWGALGTGGGAALRGAGRFAGGVGVALDVWEAYNVLYPTERYGRPGDTNEWLPDRPSEIWRRLQHGGADALAWADEKLLGLWGRQPDRSRGFYQWRAGLQAEEAGRRERMDLSSPLYDPSGLRYYPVTRPLEIGLGGFRDPSEPMGISSPLLNRLGARIGEGVNDWWARNFWGDQEGTRGNYYKNIKPWYELIPGNQMIPWQLKRGRDAFSESDWEQYDKFDLKTFQSGPNLAWMLFPPIAVKDLFTDLSGGLGDWAGATYSLEEHRRARANRWGPEPDDPVLRRAKRRMMRPDHWFTKAFGWIPGVNSNAYVTANDPGHGYYSLTGGPRLAEKPFGSWFHERVHDVARVKDSTLGWLEELAWDQVFEGLPETWQQSLSGGAIGGRGMVMDWPRRAAQRQAELIRVIDGDTLEVLIDGQVERIRLSGVNTPERGESGFGEATTFLRQALGDGPRSGPLMLDVTSRRRDDYDRIVGQVSMQGARGQSIDINRQMQGWMAAFRGQISQRRDYERLAVAQTRAAQQRVGAHLRALASRPQDLSALAEMPDGVSPGDPNWVDPEPTRRAAQEMWDLTPHELAARRAGVMTEGGELQADLDESIEGAVYAPDTSAGRRLVETEDANRRGVTMQRARDAGEAAKRAAAAAREWGRSQAERVRAAFQANEKIVEAGQRFADATLKTGRRITDIRHAFTVDWLKGLRDYIRQDKELREQQGRELEELEETKNERQERIQLEADHRIAEARKKRAVDLRREDEDRERGWDQLQERQARQREQVEEKHQDSLERIRRSRQRSMADIGRRYAAQGRTVGLRADRALDDIARRYGFRQEDLIEERDRQIALLDDDDAVGRAELRQQYGHRLAEMAEDREYDEGTARLQQQRAMTDLRGQQAAEEEQARLREERALEDLGSLHEKLKELEETHNEEDEQFRKTWDLRQARSKEDFENLILGIETQAVFEKAKVERQYLLDKEDMEDKHRVEGEKLLGQHEQNQLELIERAGEAKRKALLQEKRDFLDIEVAYQRALEKAKAGASLEEAISGLPGARRTQFAAEFAKYLETHAPQTPVSDPTKYAEIKPQKVEITLTEDGLTEKLLEIQTAPLGSEGAGEREYDYAAG